jgi:hypothetical protein
MDTDSIGSAIGIAFVVGLASWGVVYGFLKLGEPWVYAIPVPLAFLALIYGAVRASK